MCKVLPWNGSNQTDALFGLEHLISVILVLGATFGEIFRVDFAVLIGDQVILSA